MFKKKTKQNDDQRSSYGTQRMQDMMKRLNINIEKINATEVVIKTADKKIIISSPEVMKTKLMGREVFQITGPQVEAPNISEDDIALVMRKTGKRRETVAKKLEELNNDLVQAIAELKTKKKRK